MKKNDSGYALPYVLVVMTVLCLVSVSIMSTTLQSLQTQQMTLQRMEDRYGAEGEIEKLTAYLCATEIKDVDSSKIEDEIANAVATAIGKTSAVKADASFTSVLTTTSNSFSYPFAIIAEKDGATISCTMTLEGEIEGSSLCHITPKEVCYDSYTITYGGGT